MNINKIFIGGRLTKDIEVKKSQSGISVTTFSVAVNRYNKDEVDFINCTAFKGTADYLGSYGKKGSLIFVEGTLNIDVVEKTYYTKVIVSSANLIKGDSNSTNSQVNTPQIANNEVDDFYETSKALATEEDLPF
jgi:single-strand DNA-binding protein